MTNFKNSLKLFFRLSFINKSTIVISAVFVILGLACFAMSAFLGEPQGDEEYFMSIAIVTMGMCMTAVGNTLIYAIHNTKFFQSCPQAEYISTKIIPLRQAVCNVSLTAFAFILTVISMNIGLVNGNRLSDMLLCCTYSTALAQISAGLFGARAIALTTWLTGLPFMILTFTHDIETIPQFLKNIYMNGFNLPLYVSVIIFAAAMVVSTIVSLTLAKKSYKNRTTKTMAAASQLAAGGSL